MRAQLTILYFIYVTLVLRQICPKKRGSVRVKSRGRVGFNSHPQLHYFSVRLEDSNLLIIQISYTVLVIPMAMEETVCAKVPAELKKKLSSLGVNVSELIRETLQSEVDRLERERLNKLAKEVSEILKKIPPEEFTQSIRTTRDSR